jgi:hypothetical protein
MTWLDLYNFLYEQANCSKNIGKFDWQQEIKVFDYASLEYYETSITQLPDRILSFGIDTTSLETINDT